MIKTYERIAASLDDTAIRALQKENDAAAIMEILRKEVLDQ